jgi:hypothetical protein
MTSCKKRKTVYTKNDDEITFEDTFTKELNDVFDIPIKVETESIEVRLYNLISLIEDKTSTYLNHKKIIEDFRNSVIKNQEGMMNRCLECNEDMGRSNPRQLCGKTYCYNEE